MAKCPLCGKSQGPKCEGGEVKYLSGPHPCANKVGILTGTPNPWYDRPRHVVIPKVIDDAMWTIEPEPSAAGLEDLL